jgi:hypothetical protein
MNRAKKDWGSGSSGSTLALQVLGLEFKPQYCQKKKKVNKIIF